ncbi:sigma-70 family RNA polymerase sigma factor [Luteolibacter ambystomatis]|uniref:Sigma-70 family RNA polymerase sigma factor n=1 Tax=Luteolibacter ambystomatis TaxID=2824561 RepID=A0A975PGX7_9BACT|nr:sigma-70 family RNA polymerase sigma factor [Luteolibacter ambystomatis]QUE53184.1 sigma-70 family RNA polymerase sigma factor [Luteolibacter ambystomatis]
MTSPELKFNDPDFTAYARQRDEAAFRRLVENYVGLVRGTALRTLRAYPHLADDVTQSVFLRLAKKAPYLPVNLNLPVWLHQQAVWLSRDVARSEIRRRNRESTAHHMNEEAPMPAPHLTEILAPLLDAALLLLKPREREAVLLRYFQNSSFQKVGEALGISAGTAQKQVERAVEKLRAHLAGTLKSPLTQTSLIALLLLEGKAHASVPPLLAGAISNHALTSKGGVLSQISSIMTTSTKFILAGAVAGSLIAAAPLLSSNASERSASNPGDHSSRGNDSERAALEKLAPFSLPVPANTGKELLEQVKLILKEPDTERTRTRLEAYLTQLDPGQLATLFTEADTRGSDAIALRLLIPLTKAWAAIDGPGAMRACATATKDLNIGPLDSNMLLARAYPVWLDNHFDDAEQWLLRNQEDPLLEGSLSSMVGDVAKLHAAKSPDGFVAWARQIQGDDLLEAAIKCGVEGTWELGKGEDEQRSTFRNLFDQLRVQNDPDFVHTTIASLLSEGCFGLKGQESSMAADVSRLPHSQDLLWTLLNSDTSATLNGLAEAYPPEQVQAIIQNTLRSLTKIEFTSRSDGRRSNGADPAALAKYLTGQDREDQIAGFANLMLPTADQAGYSPENHRDALRWTALISDETRRGEMTDKILQSLPDGRKQGNRGTYSGRWKPWPPPCPRTCGRRWRHRSAGSESWHILLFLPHEIFFSALQWTSRRRIGLRHGDWDPSPLRSPFKGSSDIGISARRAGGRSTEAAVHRRKDGSSRICG